jgi:hypothetical protein
MDLPASLGASMTFTGQQVFSCRYVFSCQALTKSGVYPWILSPVTR